MNLLEGGKGGWGERVGRGRKEGGEGMWGREGGWGGMGGEGMGGEGGGEGGMTVIHDILIGMFNSNPMIPQYLNNNLT